MFMYFYVLPPKNRGLPPPPHTRSWNMLVWAVAKRMQSMMPNGHNCDDDDSMGGGVATPRHDDHDDDDDDDGDDDNPRLAPTRVGDMADA